MISLFLRSLAKTQSKNKLNNKNREFIFYNIAVLNSSGISILRCIEILQETTSDRKTKDILNNIQEEIKGGKTLSSAFSFQKDSNFYTNLLYIGEESGNLEKVLYKLSDYYKDKEKFKKEIIKTLTYPVVILIITLLVGIFVLFYLLPGMANILDTTSGDAAVSTKLILNYVLYIINNKFKILYEAIIALLFLFLLFCYMNNRFNISTSINRMAAFRLWQINLLKVLTILLEAGCSIQQSFNILIKNEKNILNKTYLEEVYESLAAGNLLSVALKKIKGLDSLIPIFISLGEESGRMEKYLSLCGNLIEKRYYEQLNKKMNWVQPLLLIFMGGIILIMVYTLFMPILGSMYEV